MEQRKVDNSDKMGYDVKLIEIPSRDLKVTVEYESEHLEINYSYNDSPELAIKKLLVAYINLSLAKNGVDVINVAGSI